MRAVIRRLGVVLQELALPVVLVALWWRLSASSRSLYFPPLSTILDAFAHTWLFDQIGPTLLPTLRIFVLGYGISLALGIALGLALAAVRPAADFLNPLMEFLRAMPGVALVPVFMAVLGVGSQMRLTIVVFASIWPILLNTMDGVRGLDIVAGETVTTFKVPTLRRLLSFTLPGASPQIVAGARVALSISLVAVITIEMVTPSDGVGTFARHAQMTFDLTAMWTSLILMGVVGYLLNLVFLVFERRVLTWHRNMQSAVGQ